MPGITTPQRARRSRKPTGRPNPPFILLCGPEKTGKSYEAALGTASDLIGMTYWIEIGGSEGTADYYGRIPGVRYEIVEHDGTYQDILDAVRWAIAQPRIDGKPNMIVVDNGTNMWDMLSDEQALYARRRAIRKAQENRRRIPSLDDPVVIDADLWNRAKERWGEFLWLLRRHSGPVIMIARQEIVTAFEGDKPTREKTRRIKAEKNLPAAVDAIVELHALGEAYLTGVRTLHWNILPSQSERFENFSIDTLLRRLGLQEAAAARQVVESRPEAYLNEPPEQEQQHQQPQQRPALTGEQAVRLIHQALTDKNDPEKRLRAIREQWGVSVLRQIPTRTKMFGEIDADKLITMSLKYIQEQAEKGLGQNEGGQSAGSSIPPSQGKEDQAREHCDETPPPTEDDAPPPPDPQAEEPPPGEVPEDVSEAEEPQEVPTAPQPGRQPVAGRPRKTQADRRMAIAMEALLNEADVQARLKMLTLSEYLEPISGDGDPSMIELRNYLQKQRPALIAQLRKEGYEDLAETYRAAPMPDTQIRQKFAAYFDSVPAGNEVT